MSETIIWSKNGCPYCDQAKRMLKNSGIKFEERNLSDGTWTKEQLLEDFPGVRTVPQIVLHGEKVGDYNALCKYYEDHNMWMGNTGV
jgi:glutaredoxin 3